MADIITTIKEGRAFLKQHLRDGCKCPCCGQEVKLYRRALSVAMARFLIALYRAPSLDDNWVDIKNLDVRGGDYAKTRYWGLVEIRDDSSGLWRLTQKGLKFVHDQVRVPRHALVYDGKCTGFSDQDIGIRQALGAGYDYTELMSDRG